MSREPILLAIIVHICVGQVNLDQALLLAWFNLLFTRSLWDQYARILICSQERSKLNLETLKITWERWLYPFSIGSSLSLFFLLYLFFLPSPRPIFSFFLLCLSLGSIGGTYDHLSLMQEGLQRLLVPGGKSHCFTISKEYQWHYILGILAPDVIFQLYDGAKVISIQ